MIEPMRKARKVVLGIAAGLVLVVVMEAVQIGLTVYVLVRG